MQTRPDIYGLDKTIVGLLNRDTPSVDIPIARNYGGDSSPVRGHILSRHVVEQPYSWDRTWDPILQLTELQAITGFIDADLGRTRGI